MLTTIARYLLMGWIKDWIKNKLFNWLKDEIIEFLGTKLDEYVDDPNTDADERWKESTVDWLDSYLTRKFG